MLLYDVSHTSHSPARTGVQRVVLCLRKAIREQTDLAEITHDPYQGLWRRLETWERKSLDAPAVAATKRGARWPLSAQLRGWWKQRQRNGAPGRVLPAEAEGFFTPEIFTRRTAAHLPELFDQLKCPKVALFHDAISLRLPDITPPSAVGRFPTYLAELRAFDGIVAVSEDSKNSLEQYWAWAGWGAGPPVMVSSLGLDHLVPASAPEPVPRGPSAPTVLSVGSLEGRKNHLTLLEACASLWDQGQSFQLQIIGTLQKETGRKALARIQELQNIGRPIRYDGWLPDNELSSAYEQCSFTVYPSIMEGFGLPVWESLIRGKPCVCSQFGATGETASGGGCIAVNTRSSHAMAAAISSLLTSRTRLDELVHQARSRQLPTWSDCATRIREWIAELA